MIKIAIFASGTGTNFVALARHIEETNVPIRIACLVCDKPDAPVVEKAVRLGIPVWTHRLERVCRQNGLRTSNSARVAKIRFKTNCVSRLHENYYESATRSLPAGHY